MTQCSLSKVNRRYGGKHHLLLQGRRISKARNQREVGSKQSTRQSPKEREAMGTGGSFYPTGEPTGTELLPCISLFFPTQSEISVSRLLCLLPDSRCFLVWFILRPWRWRKHVPPKRRLTFNRLHSIISDKTELFAVIIFQVPWKRAIFFKNLITRNNL
jgi:hypothetical protein